MNSNFLGPKQTDPHWLPGFHVVRWLGSWWIITWWPSDLASWRSKDGALRSQGGLHDAYIPDYANKKNMKYMGGPGILTQVPRPFPTASLPTEPRAFFVYGIIINNNMENKQNVNYPRKNLNGLITACHAIVPVLSVAKRFSDFYLRTNVCSYNPCISQNQTQAW